MKHVLFLLLTAGIVMSTACSSNETMNESDEDSDATTETAPAATPARTTKPAPPEPVEAVVDEEAEPETDAGDSQETTTTSSGGSSITYVCTHGDSVRTIRVIYHDEGPKACEVTYEKSTGTQSLWSAISDEAFCEDRAAEFVTKQEGWGWECNKE